MRPLRAVVNDVARAMRRNGRRLCPKLEGPPDEGYTTQATIERVAGSLLIGYAEMLTAATKRQPKTARKGKA